MVQWNLLGFAVANSLPGRVLFYQICSSNNVSSLSLSPSLCVCMCIVFILFFFFFFLVSQIEYRLIGSRAVVCAFQPFAKGTTSTRGGQAEWMISMRKGCRLGYEQEEELIEGRSERYQIEDFIINTEEFIIGDNRLAKPLKRSLPL